MSKQWQIEMKNTGTSESIVSTFLKGTCPTCINLFSRDFLDFFTEGLSGAITQLQPSQREVVNYYARGMKKNIKTLQKVAQTARHSNIDTAATNGTLAVVLFNGDMSNRVSGRMKLLLFQSTFWSVYRHFGSVLVMTKSAADRDAVRALGLPALEVSNLDLHTNVNRKLDYYTKVEAMHAELVKRSLQVTAQRWRNDTVWTSGFTHLYFSQGDQLLHARRLDDIYRAMAVEPEGNFAAAPHTMQTLTLAQSLPQSLQTTLWPQPNTTVRVPSGGASIYTSPSAARRSTATQQSPQWLPGARIFAENAETVIGSCCEHGRFIFPECISSGSRVSSSHLAERAGRVGGGAKLDKLYGEHGAARALPAEMDAAHRAATVLYVTHPAAVPWTACAQWGPRNFSDWIALGKAGFTMPTVTTGLAYCQYSPTALQCPLPGTKASTAGGCSSGDDASRMPRRVNTPSSSSSSGGDSSSMFDVCSETLLVRVNKFALDRLSKEDALRLLQATRESEAPAVVHPASAAPPPPLQQQRAPDLLHSSHAALLSQQRSVAPAPLAVTAASTLAVEHELPSGLHRRRGQRGPSSSEN